MKFEYDGSLVLCVLAQLKETESGLALIGEKCILLSQIMDAVSGQNCKNLIGKPKLLFFIDEGTKQDHSGPNKEIKVYHCSALIFICVGSHLIFSGYIPILEYTCRRLHLHRFQNLSR
jgi:hypothetical protein